MVIIAGVVVLFMRVYAIWYCSKAMLCLFALAYIVSSSRCYFQYLWLMEWSKPGHIGALYDVVAVTRSATAGMRVPYIFSRLLKRSSK